ncbi:MAG: hypothetical protein CSB47_07195 [Proteobacteria bacterium]|nr:MAG: hypothetical protein CSB47_07195 [Pseudomonadota bacterium]
MIYFLTKKMLHQSLLLRWVMLLWLGMAQTLVFAGDEISIAVVNVAYLIKNAPEAELASQALKADFLPKEKALQKKQEHIRQLEAERDQNKSTWSAEKVRQADRQIRALERERTRALEDFREELRFARDSALDDVQKSVFQAIEEVRKQKNIDIVIQEYVAASQRVNVTDEVLEYLRAQLTLKQSGRSKQHNKKEK